MADYEDNDFVIREGMDERIKKLNKLEPGSEEELRAMKSAEIQYNLYLKEAEVGAKLVDLEERRKLEREKMEREAEFREEEAIKASKWDKIKTYIAGGAVLTSLVATICGFVVDHVYTDDIRNSAGERDVSNLSKDTRSFTERLLGR